jgi:hypothetical protein
MLPEVHDGFEFVLMIRTRRFSTSFMHDYHFMESNIKCENLTKKYNFKCDGIIIQSKTNTKCHTFSTVLQSNPNIIDTETTSIVLQHIYMTAHFSLPIPHTENLRKSAVIQIMSCTYMNWEMKEIVFVNQSIQKLPEYDDSLEELCRWIGTNGTFDWREKKLIIWCNI